MPAKDVAKLRIEKAQKVARPGRRRIKPLVVACLLALLLTAGGLSFGGVLGPACTVDVTTVSRFYPSQSLSLLNASGYVVAQRKAAISTIADMDSLQVEERPMATGWSSSRVSKPGSASF